MSARRRVLLALRNAATTLLVILGLVSWVAGPSAAAPVPGDAGIDTSLPATDSEVTVAGRGEFDDLRVTVNQTEDLANQAISITWSGAHPTERGNGARFAQHYLQIMQCWGEPDGAVPENPGPPPEQCVFGASNAVFGGGRLQGQFPPGGFTVERRLAVDTWDGFDPSEGEADGATTWRPFVAVNGERIVNHIDATFNPAIQGGQYWRNPHFNVVTSNEIPGAFTGPAGTGEELFEVTTGRESSGLGCGQRVQPVVGGDPIEPRCWLVIVPRGSAAVENEGSPFDASFGVMTSPLRDVSWQHRIAIPLEFSPLESGCDISEQSRRLGGSELPLHAIASWQQPLCSTEGLPPYVYGLLGDDLARRQLYSVVAGSVEMIVVSRPIDPTTLDPENPPVYVPLTLSGLAIGFMVERTPLGSAPDEEQELDGRRVERLNLTPRLVAKLLTQSYRAQTAIAGPSPYEWAPDQPNSMMTDPDFLRFNPEFELLLPRHAKNLGGLIAPSGTSDAARQVWEWILADPEAKAWLDGEPDEWGMVVNPVYATSGQANSSGLAFGDPAPEVFPKADPYCYEGAPQGPAGTVIPPPLCGTDWLPYKDSYEAAAAAVLVADDGAAISHDPFALVPSDVWSSGGPQIGGSRSMLAIVDTPSAARFGLQVARLSRAGDAGDDRQFLAPTPASLSAAVEAMEPGVVPEVLQPVPTADAPDAYPLAALTYGAVAPLTIEQEARDDYAAFLEYATGAGQEPGLKVGQLPPGYAPLTDGLRAQAAAGITDIRALGSGSEPSTTTTTNPDGVPVPTGEGAPATPGPSDASRSAAPVAATSAPVASDPVLPAEDEPNAAPALNPGFITPVLALANSRFVLPILALIALSSALGAVEVTRRPGLQPAGVVSMHELAAGDEP